MRHPTVVWLLFAVAVSTFTSTHSLPFTRGSKGDGDEVAEAVIEGDDVIKIVPAKGAPRRMEFVEAFFGGDLDSSQLQQEIKSRALNMTNHLVTTRRTLHRHPELMYQEEQTSLVLQQALKELGVSYTTGWAVNTHTDRMPGKGGYGIVADIGTGKPPCVLLRADIDALPILERTEGVDSFKSLNNGKMHACGHDGHTTMLLGATAMLKDIEDSLNGLPCGGMWHGKTRGDYPVG